MAAMSFLVALLTVFSLSATPAKSSTLNKLLKGPLNPETIKDVIHEHHAELRACALKRAPAMQSVSGKIIVGFTILPTGKVAEVATQSSTLHEPDLEACLLTAVRAWTFPKPKKGPVGINFPFRFGPPPAKENAPSEKHPQGPGIRKDKMPTESEPDLLD
jgi:TonB family protein